MTGQSLRSWERVQWPAQDSTETHGLTQGQAATQQG